MVESADSAARRAKIAELRRQIADGSYETPDKLEAAVEEFLRDYEEGALRPGENRPSRPK